MELDKELIELARKELWKIKSVVGTGINKRGLVAYVHDEKARESIPKSIMIQGNEIFITVFVTGEIKAL